MTRSPQISYRTGFGDPFTGVICASGPDGTGDEDRPPSSGVTIGVTSLADAGAASLADARVASLADLAGVSPSEWHHWLMLGWPTKLEMLLAE